MAMKIDSKGYNLSDPESHKEFIEDLSKFYGSKLDSIIKAENELVNDCHYSPTSLQDIDPLVRELIHYKKYGEFKFYTGVNSVGKSELDICADNYKDGIQKIEDKITDYKKDNEGATLEQANLDLFKNGDEGRQILSEADKNALCIVRNRGNPDDYVVLSDEAQEIVNYDHEFLSDMAPNLVEYATVNEFGNPIIRGLVLASAVGIPIILSKAHATENIYKMGYKVKSSLMKLADRLF